MLLIRALVLAFGLALGCMASIAEASSVEWNGEQQLDLTPWLSARLVSSQTAADVYLAKESGRNQVVADPLTEQL